MLAPGAQIYREGEPVSRFAVVKKGLVARKLGTYGAKSDNQIGLAGPGNIATGNLNIFSHRPAVGAYEAILPTSIVWCEHREFFEIARRNPDLLHAARHSVRTLNALRPPCLRLSHAPELRAGDEGRTPELDEPFRGTSKATR